MILVIYRTLVSLLILSLLGYIFMVFKEKFYLKQNMIVLDNKYLNERDIEEVDVSEFIFQGIKARSGDEVIVRTDKDKKYQGIIIGIEFKENKLHIIDNHKNKIQKINIANIKRFEMLSKYGKFF